MKKMTPELIAQLVNPEDAHLSAGSNVPVLWQCAIDPRHIWPASPNTRKRSPACPVCLNKVIIPGVNDLATTDPKLAATLTDPSVALRVHRGSHTSVEWTCTTDPRHQWPASVVSRTRLASGCPYCSGRIPISGVNDLETTHPSVAGTLVDPRQAKTVMAGSATKLFWQCQAETAHTWLAQVRNRTGAGQAKITGCPDCLGRTKRPAQRHPTLKELASPLLNEAVDPEATAQLSSGSGKIVLWHCPDCGGGHDYPMSVRHKMRGQGCPVKAGVQIMAGVNDLATTHPLIAAQMVDPSLATTLSRGSVTPVEWRCASNHSWVTPAYARVAGNGCPDCCPLGSSYGEQEMFAALLALDPSAQHRAIVTGADGRRIEVDTLVGNTAFEFNGVFWHSEAGGRDQHNHLSKLTALHELGLTLVTVWGDDWADLDKRAVLVRTFAHRLRAPQHLDNALAAAGIEATPDPTLVERIGARSLSLAELSGSAAAEFYRHNHVQGAVALTRSFALLDGQGLPRAVLGLRSPRHNARANRPEGQWEIQRYATRGNIPGGFSRLITHAERVLSDQGELLNSWISLSANESSDGQLYAASGFTNTKLVRPSYWYAGGHLRGQRAPKEAFQLKRFRTDEALIYQEGWTEREAAEANKLYRVWDAGKTQWTKAVA